MGKPCTIYLDFEMVRILKLIRCPYPRYHNHATSSITSVAKQWNFVALIWTLNILLWDIRAVTPILNVPRKFSMCVILSTGYIKIYNNKSSNEYYIQQITFVLQQNNTYRPYVIKISLSPWHSAALRTSTCWNIHPTSSFQNHPAYLKHIRIGMRHNVSVSST
jgi:hypothetical protein